MFKKFPLIYIALSYIFSTKDKLVFFMQQFSMLSISLSMAIIICSFSIMNGFYFQVRQSIPIDIGDIGIYLKFNENGDKINFLKFNQGFVEFKLNNSNIKSIRYGRYQQTLVNIEHNKYNPLVIVRESNVQKEPIIVTTSFMRKNDIKDNSIILNILDPQSYNPIFGSLTRSKAYKNYKIIESSAEAIYLSSNDYKKLFRNDNYNSIAINLKDTSKFKETINEIKPLLSSDFIIQDWKDVRPDILNLLSLQTKIFYLLYIVMFILLSAIIISTNIAFFKEKRKDWALFKILNIMPYSVERIFLYKNCLFYFFTLLIGLSVGSLLAVFSNELLSLVSQAAGQGATEHIFFQFDRITYQFKLWDFFIVSFFSFSIYFVNFITLIFIFRKENIASFLNSN